MAVFVYPKEISKVQLLQEIYNKIDSSHGTPTWERRQQQIIHTTENGQWDKGAFLINEDTFQPYLFFRYDINDGATPGNDAYGVYNGRFVQFLLNHFTQYIERFEVVDKRPR